MTGWTGLRKLGFADDVNDTEIHVSPLNQLIPDLTAGVQMEVVSTSAQDGPGGTGLRQVILRYLDPSYVQHDEFIATNGLTPVATAATNVFRLNRFSTVQVGSAGCAVGNVTVRLAGGGQPYLQIRGGRTGAEACIFTVPAGVQAVVEGFHAAVAAPNKSGIPVDLRLATTVNESGVVTPGVYYTQDITTLIDANLTVAYGAPIAVPSTATIRLTAVATAHTTHARVAARLDIFFFANPA